MATTDHPYLDIYTASLVPHLGHGPGHDKDPPSAGALLPLAGVTPEAQKTLDLLLGADRDVRGDHDRAAGINLDLAETRLRRAQAQDGAHPGLEVALRCIARAREEMAKHDTRRACAALNDAIRAVAGPRRA